MDAQDITFGLKDVGLITGGVLSLAGVFWGLKIAIGAVKSALILHQETSAAKYETLEKLIKDVEKKIQDNNVKTDERFLHAKNSKKANIQYIMDQIKDTENDFDKREAAIYHRIDEISKEHKEAHLGLSTKMEQVSTQLQSLNTNFAELNGYLRGQKENKK
jgi:hypothetical protein